MYQESCFWIAISLRMQKTAFDVNFSLFHTSKQVAKVLKSANLPLY